MATAVKILIVDPDAHYHRAIQSGERAVDAGGDLLFPLSYILGVDNDADGLQIKNLADPTADQDAATKIYVDTELAKSNELHEILANGNDAGCQDIVNIDAIYFCDYGSSSSSSAGVGEPSNLWIRPDRVISNKLIYHAPGGHKFESPAEFTGTVTGIAIKIGANTLDTTEWAFLDGQNQTVATTSSPTFANVYVPSGGAVGVSGSGRITFDDMQFVHIPEGYLDIGVVDSQRGMLRLFGPGTGFAIGGSLTLATAADHDTSIDSYKLDAYEDDLLFIQHLTTKLTLQGSDGKWLFGADVNMGTNAISNAGAITGTAITATSFVIGGNTLTTTEWAFLDGQNQTVATTSSPTFEDMFVTDGGIVGISGNETIVFNAAGTITVTGAVLVLASGFRTPLATKVNDYVVDADDHTILADASGNSVDVTLPAAADVSGQIYVIKRIDDTANDVRVVAQFGEDIDANQHYFLVDRWDSITVQSDGTNWFIIGAVEGSLEPSSSASA